MTSIIIRSDQNSSSHVIASHRHALSGAERRGARQAGGEAIPSVRSRLLRPIGLAMTIIG